MPDDVILDGTTPPDTPPANDGAAPKDEGTPPAEPLWTDSLPESLRVMAAEAKDMTGLEAALKRGLAHIPVEKAEDVEIPLPEGVDAEQTNLKWFRDVAVEHGFSKGQVNALAEAYNKEISAAHERMHMDAEKALRGEYGDEYEAKMAKANDAARRFDRMCGGTDEEPGALRKILNMGLGNHPDFIRAMVMIGESVSDSAMPGVSHGGGGTEAMTTEDFIKSVMPEK